MIFLNSLHLEFFVSNISITLNHILYSIKFTIHDIIIICPNYFSKEHEMKTILGILCVDGDMNP